MFKTETEMFVIFSLQQVLFLNITAEINVFFRNIPATSKYITQDLIRRQHYFHLWPHSTFPLNIPTNFKFEYTEI